jgi:hypothetical protein
MYFQAAMAGVSVISSIMGSKQANENLYKNQLAIVSGQKSRNVQLTNKMEQTIRAGGIAKSQAERLEMQVLARNVALKATSKLAGQSALYAYMNVGQQTAFTQGTIQSKIDGSLREDGTISQKYANQAASQINTAESKKKSGMTMFIEAAVAGASAYGASNTFAEAAKTGPSWLNTATSW